MSLARNGLRSSLGLNSLRFGDTSYSMKSGTENQRSTRSELMGISFIVCPLLLLGLSDRV